MSRRTQVLEVAKVRGFLRETRADEVAVEEPLEVRLGYDDGSSRRTRCVSITMRTPGNDEDLALGFLYAESIVRSAADVAFVKPCSGDNTLRVELEDGVGVELDRLERHFYTTSSCGVCGKTSLEALRANGIARVEGRLQISHDDLVALPDRLRATQEVFARTGGLHAAGAFDSAGEITIVREDVGRHNAVDKVVGALLRSGQLPASGYGLVVSGRASFELMQKTAAAGMPLLAAVGAPSSLAVEMAREFNVTLVGFLRDGSFNIYAGEERIS
jgi:FdhD protein